MAWGTPTDAVVVTGGGSTDGITSTGTIVVWDGSYRYHLRMFGDVLATSLSFAGGIAPEDAQGPNPTSPYVPEGTGYNIGYIDSRASDEADPLEFVFAIGGQPWIRSTVVPRKRFVPVTDDVHEVYDTTGVPKHEPGGSVGEYHVRYKDPSIVELGNSRGRLMLLGRYRRRISDGDFGKDVGATPGFAYGDIVAYWAAEDDPGFEGEEVRGPFWLVSSMWAVPGMDRIRFWLGVPSGVVVDEGGTTFLFVYYQAEESEYGSIPPDTAYSGFIAGIYLRKIALSDLLGHIPIATATPSIEMNGPWTIESELGIPVKGGFSGPYVTVPADPRASDETAWSDLTAAGLIPGWTAGRVRVWRAEEWTAGGNELIVEFALPATEDIVKLADPAAALCGSGLVLFFSTICGKGMKLSPTSPTPPTINPVGSYETWGVWRARAIPAAYASTYGIDFLIGDDDPSVYQLVSDPLLILHADPDPVLLPDGTWVVFASGEPYLQIEGSLADGCGSPINFAPVERERDRPSPF